MARDMPGLLDAFAEVRRTWDELIGQQPEDHIEIMRAETGDA